MRSIFFIGVLAVCFLLLLPGRAFADVAVLSHEGYIDSFGYYHVAGEVQNAGDQAVRSVKIDVTFYNASGIAVASRFDMAMLDIILVGRKSPFDVILRDSAQSAQVVDFGINVTFSATDSIPVGLDILSHSSYIDNDEVMHITGEIENKATEEALNVKVIATFYNETGDVVAASLAYLDPEGSNLGPNETSPFDIQLDGERVPYVYGCELTAESAQYACDEVPKYVVGEYSSILILVAVPSTLLAIFAIRLDKRKVCRRSGCKSHARAVRTYTTGERSADINGDEFVDILDALILSTRARPDVLFFDGKMGLICFYSGPMWLLDADMQSK